MKLPCKRSKSSASSKSTVSTRNEQHKVCQVTVGEGFNNLSGKLDGILGSLEVIAHPKPVDQSTLPDKHTTAIKMIQQNELLTEDDFGDLWMLLTDNHKVGSIYLAIGNLKQCTMYIKKQLECHCQKI